MVARASLLEWVRWLIVLALLSGMIAATSAGRAVASRQAGEVIIAPRGDAASSGQMPGAGPSAQPAIGWEASSNDGVIMGMAIVGDTLYFTSKDPGIVTAIERATGTVRWTLDLGPEATVFGPAPAGDVVAVGVWAEGANGVVGIDRATGAERWRYPTESLPKTPAHLDGTLYIPAEGGLSAEPELIALDAATGAERWTFLPPDAGDLGDQAAVSDGVVVSGTFAVDAATGQQLWTFPGPDNLSFEPVISDGVVIAVDLPTAWGLDLRTGQTLWEIGASPRGGGVAAAGGVAYFGFGDEVRAVDLRTGQDRWSAPVSGIAGAPVVAGGIVYSAVWKPSDDRSNHWIHAFDAASGTETWALELQHRVDGNGPLAADGVLYVDTNDAVVAFGSPVAQGQPGGTSPTIPPAQADPGVYQSPEFGHVIAWSPPWSLVGPQSSSAPGEDFITLQSGDGMLALRATTQVTSAVELIRFYASEIQMSHNDAQLFDLVEAPDFSRATARFTVDGVAMVEYIEVRPLPAGNGLFLSILYGPASGFAQQYLTVQQLVTVDQQRPFRDVPAGAALSG